MGHLETRKKSPSKMLMIGEMVAIDYETVDVKLHLRKYFIFYF
jgi:hypothetical protein